MNVDDLEAFIDETIRLAGRKGYYPSVFQGMRSRHGTIKAIEKLVQTGEVQSGFKRLTELGLLEWSIEAAVLRFPDRFTPAARDCAEFRIGLVRNGPEVIKTLKARAARPA
jgi:hypothetical protein